MRAAKKPRRGMALLVILVLIVMAALGAYSFTFTMESQYRLTNMHEDQVHARLAAASGIELVTAILEQPVQARSQWGSLRDNPDLFGGIEIDSPVGSHSRSELVDAWRVSIISPGLMDETENDRLSAQNRLQRELSFNFGIQNESAKIHLPTLAIWDSQQPGYARQVLMSLPGANPELVDSILASISAVRETNTNRNGISEGASHDSDRLTLDPLPLSSPGSTDRTQATTPARISRGVWPKWLGQDLNQNYALDPIESALRLIDSPNLDDLSMGQDSRLANMGEQGQSLRGDDSSISGLAWKNFLTWHNGGRHETYDGRRRVLLNQPDLQNLHRQLMEIWPADWANYVVAVRQYGGQLSGWNGGTFVGAGAGIGNPMEASAIAPDFSVPPTYSLSSPLELVGSWIMMPALAGSGPGDLTNFTLLSPLRDEINPQSNYLGRLLDDVTTDSQDFFEGRVDINNAPRWVLSAVPGMSRELAEQIIQRRSSGSEAVTSTGNPTGAGAAIGASPEGSGAIGSRATIAWLLEEGLVDLPQLIRLEPYLTARSDVYSCQAVGFKNDLHAVYRCTLIVDAREQPAVVREFQTWHPWDRGFDSISLNPRSERSSMAGSSPSVSN